jgi:nicotinamide riboside kinase
MPTAEKQVNEELKKRLNSLSNGNRPVRKIWISGGPGVGKTALIHGLIGELKWRDKTVEWIDEVIRDCPFPIDKGADFKTEMWIIEHQHYRELQKLKHMPQFVLCDRGMLDQAVYGTMLFDGKKMSEKEYNIILTTVLEWMKTYDFGIVASPSDKEITTDGFRATNKDYQWEMHNYFLSVLNALGADYVVIKGSHEERIKQVIGHMKKKGFI